MPTYAYVCKKCGNAFDRFESITSKPNKSCPKCKSRQAERQISGGAGLIFKGTGFYTTDYKKGGNKSEAKKDSGGTKDKGSTESTTPAPKSSDT